MFKTSSWRQRLTSIVIEIIVVAFVILWCYTAINKYFDFQNFSTQIKRSPFIEGIANIITYALPTGELILALLLVLSITRKLAMYLSFGVMLMFTGYIYLMLNFAYDLPCSCGGVLAEMTWQDHLVFNIAYTFLGLIGIFILELKEGLNPQQASLISN